MYGNWLNIGNSTILLGNNKPVRSFKRNIMHANIIFKLKIDYLECSAQCAALGMKPLYLIENSDFESLTALFESTPILLISKYV